MPRTVLIVSDSMGTPIHGRGILNYTAGLVGALSRTDAALTLLVETPRSFRSEAGRPEMEGLSERAAHAIKLTSIYSYLAQGSAAYSLKGKNRSRRLQYKAMALWRRLADRLGLAGWATARQVDIVSNSRSDLAPASRQIGYLAFIKSFALSRKVYTESLLRAAYGLRPRTISARGFDTVLVDTAHFIRIDHDPQACVIVVIHDLIPLYDPGTADWRTVFAKKLLVSVRQATHLVFVSETTRTEFQELFPNFADIPSMIVAPTIRQELIDASSSARPAFPAHASNAIPTFVAIVSDEPRKNIAYLVDAFAHLKGVADLVIVGKVDKRKYLTGTKRISSNVKFAGYVSDREKMALLQTSDALVFASTMEGFGIPLVEGALFNLPVFCSDIPVFRECTNDLATYFDPFKPDQLVAQVNEFARDRASCLAKAPALREFCIASYGPEATAAKLQALFASLPAR